MKKDEKFMKIAIEVAKKSNVTPYSAIIVKNNKVIAKACNKTYEKTDSTAHAEINAIRKACKKLKTRNLSKSILYTICEPCPMCLSACWWANISRIVYGATINDAKKRGRQIDISSEFLAKRMKNIILTKGVLRKECVALLKSVK